MSSSFQPEQPHQEAGASKGRGVAVVTALLAALVAILVLGVLAPRLFGDTSVNWWATLGAGAGVFLAVLIAGLRRRNTARR